MRILLLLLPLLLSPLFLHAEEYKSTHSGIANYWIGPTWIKIKFKNSSLRYKYEENHYGKKDIDHMKTLAKKGEGLNSYINKVKKEKQNALRLIGNLCGDTWCEGQTNYNFTQIVCLEPVQTCVLYYTITSADDIETVGNKGYVTLTDTNMTDFYPTKDDWLKEETVNKLFALFD